MPKIRLKPSSIRLFNSAVLAFVSILFLWSHPAAASENSVQITSPKQYQVIQRNSVNLGAIGVTGTYTGTPDSIEARWNNGPWTLLDTAPVNGTYSGTIANQPAGQGVLEVRFSNDPGTVSTVLYIGVGDIYVCAGQSNMSGRGTTAQTYSHPILKASLLGNNYNWSELIDPYDAVAGQVDLVSRESVTVGGSIILPLATELLSRSGVPVAFIPAAKGGTSIMEWQPGSNPQDRSTLYGSMIYRAIQAGGVKAVLWWQGEADAQNSMSQATYNSYLDTLANAIASDLGVKIMPCKLLYLDDMSIIDDPPAQNRINAAIEEAISDNPNVLRGPDLSGISTDDGLHIKSTAKLIQAAALWADALVQPVDPLDHFVVEDVLTGLEQPMGLRFLPDGRMLVIQKKGQIQIVNLGPSTNQAELYMDLADPGHLNGLNSGQERGLLDIAIDPEFPSSPYVYIFYTPTSGPNGAKSRIARFTHLENSGGITSRGDLSSEVILWEDTDGYDSCCHYGGGLDFGPDGKLWLTTGDHFQGSYAASLEKAGGSVIRINKDGSIPSDNPFVDGTGPNVDSIFAYGLRNPFRARWDLPSGRFLIGEVGGNEQSIAWEDLHLIQYDHETERFVDGDFGTPEDNGLFNGIHFGWPQCEGLPPHQNFPGCIIEPVAEPLFGYAHNGTTAAINGGVIYRGTNFPAEFQGTYFYADSTRDFIRYLKFNSDGTVAPNPNPGLISDKNPESISYPFDLAPMGRIVYLDVGPDGTLYYVSFTDSGGAYGQPNPFVMGAVRRYVYEGSNIRPEIVEFKAEPASGPNPLTVEFTIRAEHPASAPMNYTLFYGDGNSTGPLPLSQGVSEVVPYTYFSDGSYQARLEVSDDSKTASETTDVLVGTPPVITMLGTFNSRSGSATNMFRFGDTITFSAIAEDHEDGLLSGANFSWSISFVRPGNTHPAFGPTTNVSSIEFPIPAQGQGFSGPVYYKCFLTVTDSSGLSTSASLDIFPEKADILFETVPSGILVQINGNTAKQTPFVLDTLINYDHVITVAPIECVGGTEYQFENWTQGGTTTQLTYVVPETNSSLTAIYSALGDCPSSLPPSGLVMHLKTDAEVVLDGTNVISWRDQSGNNNHLNNSGNPVLLENALNGHDAVHFDGLDDALARSGFIGLPTGSADRSMFMVARYNQANSTGGAWAGFTYGTPLNNKVFGLALTPAGDLGIQGWGKGNDILSNPSTAAVGMWMSQGAVLEGNILRQYKDLTAIGSASHTFATGIDGIRLGEEINGGKNLNMDVAEIVVYNRAVSDSEREQIQLYFEQKYSFNNARPEILEFSTFPQTGTPPLEVTFDIRGSDLNGDKISYIVHFGDGTSTGTAQELPENSLVSIPHVYEVSGSYQARLEISDGLASSFETNIISVGSSPIIISLGSFNSRDGAHTNLFRFGDTITFSGEATDQEDGLLEENSFTWTIDFVGAESSTLISGPHTNTTSITFPIPAEPEGFSGPVFFRCKLVVRDSSGQSASQTLNIFPEKVDILVDTIPSGIPIQVDGSNPIPTPFIIDTLVNYSHVFTAPPAICLSNQNHLFTSWSEGSVSQQQNYIARDTNSVVTANYIPGNDCNTSLPQAGLVMHLKPGAGLVRNRETVTRWDDQSASGNHLNAVGAPSILAGALNGQDVIHFDGVDDALTRSGFTGLPTGSGSRSIFMFARYNSPNANGTGWAGFAYGTASNNKVFGLAINSSGTLGIQGWGTGNDVLSNPATDGVGQWFTQGAIYNSGVLQQYKNRSAIGTKTKTFNTGTASIRLGEEINGGKNLNMDVAEIIVYNRAVSESELSQIQGYFESKYLGEGPALPSETPPTLTISSPLNHAQFTTADGAIEFSGVATDAEDGNLSMVIAWASNLDGELGTGGTISVANLSPGTHNIIAVVQDSDSLAATNSLTVTVTSGIPVHLTEMIQLFDGLSLNGLYPWFKSSGFSDPKQVFKIANGNLHVSGNEWGALITQKRYRDYVMLLEFKWGSQTWSPRQGKAKDAGLLFHGNGAHGGYENVLIPSVQAQMMEGSTGDIILLRGQANAEPLPLSFTAVTEQVACLTETWNCRGGHRWNELGLPQLFQSRNDTVHWYGWDPAWTDTTGFRGAVDLESPDGQWNQLVVIANGTKAEIFLNGIKVNEVGEIAVSEGKIQLEVEFAEFFVRRWTLAPIGSSIPPIIPIDSLQNGIVGVAYNQLIPARGGTGALSWTVSNGNLPNGLTLDSTTGLLAGTPVSEGNYSFDIQVNDEVGSVASQDFIIAISGENTGLITSGLVLQLEADLNVALQTGSTVAAWLDQSGLGNDLVAGGNPQLIEGLTPSGKPAISLDGNDKFERIHVNDPLGGLPTGNGNRTIFLVSKYNSSTAWAGLAYGNGAKNQAYGILAKHPTGELVLHGWGTGNDLVTSAPGLGAGWLLQTAILNNGVGSIFVGGSQVAQWNHNYNTVLSKLVIGEEIKNLGFVAMDVAAVLIYDRALSTSEREEVEDFLQVKYLQSPTLALSTTEIEASASSTLRRQAETKELQISHVDGLIRIQYPTAGAKGHYHLHAVADLETEHLGENENRLATSTRMHSGDMEPVVFQLSPNQDRLFFQVIFEPAE